MDDIFDNKSLSPMLIGIERAPFDDEDYIYELKLDGVRCLLYLDDETQLWNKRKLSHTSKFPELQNLHKQAKCKCILDGELFVYHDQEIDFFEIQRRTLMSDPFKIRMAAHTYPASFTAFDILYYQDHTVIDLPLMKRKKLLEKAIKENERLTISRYIEKEGTQLFALTKQQHLEGIVAKRKDSLYYPGKRTKDWIKCKHLLEDDFVICGYIEKAKGIISFILGQYHDNVLQYKGHVTMGASLRFFKDYPITKVPCPFPQSPDGNEDAVWIKPEYVAIVSFMMYTAQGGLRQPVLKAIRDDKEPYECQVKSMK